MRVILVEDEYLTASWIAEAVHHHYPEAEIVDIANEAQFERSFRSFELEPPDLVIMDVMLAQEPTVDVLDPAEIHRGLRAGIRCLNRLLGSQVLGRVPVIIHTALDSSEIADELPKKPPHVVYVQKTNTLEPLHVQIPALLNALGKASAERGPNVLTRIGDALEVKPGAFGVSFDVKKVFSGKSTRRRRKDQ